MATIHIPRPCNENWENMTPDEKGRFCALCQKQVIDFTQMSDTEILNFFQQKEDKRICGRFRKQQLERPLANTSLNLSESWFARQPFKKQIFYAIGLFFILGISACTWDNKDQPTESIPQITGITLIDNEEHKNRDSTKPDTLTYEYAMGEAGIPPPPPVIKDTNKATSPCIKSTVKKKERNLEPPQEEPILITGDVMIEEEKPTILGRPIIKEGNTTVDSTKQAP